MASYSKYLKYIWSVSLLLAAVGAVNWGLVAWFDMNLVTSIFGQGTLLTKVVYSLAALGGLGQLFRLGRMYLMSLS